MTNFQGLKIRFLADISDTSASRGFALSLQVDYVEKLFIQYVFEGEQDIPSSPFDLYVNSGITVSITTDEIQPTSILKHEPPTWTVFDLLSDRPLDYAGILFRFKVSLSPTDGFNGINGTPVFVPFIKQYDDLIKSITDSRDNLESAKRSRGKQPADQENILNQPTGSPFWHSIRTLIYAAWPRFIQENSHFVITHLNFLLETTIKFFRNNETREPWHRCLAHCVGEHVARGAHLLTMDGTFNDHEILLAKYKQTLDATTMSIVQSSGMRVGPFHRSSLDPTVKNFWQDYDVNSRTIDITSPTSPKWLRLIDCQYLVKERRLRLVDIDINEESELDHIPYSAVSYVSYGYLGPRDAGDPEDGYFTITSNGGGEHIKIDILIQIAQISLDSGLSLTWIDRICSSQNYKAEGKADQIQRMCNLYTNCGLCIIVPNGLFALASPDQCTPWLQRMWTLHEGFLPEHSTVMFEWTRGSGILMNVHEHMREYSGPVVGYIEQRQDGVGTLPLTSLLQVSGGAVAFINDSGSVLTYLRFRILGEDYADPFYTTMALYKMRASMSLSNHFLQLQRQESKNLDIYLWLSILRRDSEDISDILSIICYLLQIQTHEDVDGEVPNRMKMNEQQKLALHRVLDISSESGSFYWHSERKMSQLVFDHCYASNIGLCSDRKSKKTYDTESRKAWPADAPDIHISNTSRFFNYAISSLTELSLRGEGPDPSHRFSVTALSRITLLGVLPKLCRLRLARMMVHGDGSDGPLQLRRLESLYLDCVYPSGLCPPENDFASLLSIFDVDELWITGVPSSEARPSPGEISSSSASLMASTETRFEHLICGFRDLHVDCNTRDLHTWLFAFMSVDDYRSPDSQPDNALCRLEVMCEDMRGAYLLGEFLASPAGISVETLSLDLQRLCELAGPRLNSWRGYDSMQAILGPCPDKNLAIRLACIDIEYSHQPSTQSKGMYVGHPNESHISALLAIADVLKNRNIESCTIEVTLAMHAKSTANTIVTSLATAHLAHAFSAFIKYGWPKCFTTLGFLWSCTGDGAANHSEIDPIQLLTKLPAALRAHHQHEDALTDESVAKLEDEINNLIQNRVISSVWYDQQPVNSEGTLEET